MPLLMLLAMPAACTWGHNRSSSNTTQRVVPTVVCQRSGVWPAPTATKQHPALSVLLHICHRCAECVLVFFEAGLQRVEIFDAGKVLEDGDILFLDGHEMEIVLSERRVEQEFLKAVGAPNFEILRSESSLRIRRTQLSTLPEIFCHLRDLRRLDIYDAWLCDLPDDIGQLSELQTLRITHTVLSALPESIGQLQELKSLDLSSNKLTTLPNTLGQLVWLSELNLGNNVLTELPEQFVMLQGLHHLDLRFNWLTTLPKEIGKLTWVRKVNVEVNRLTRLPESIVNLQWLQCLHLGWNLLEELPDGFGQLVWLRELHLRGNRIAALPDGFRDLLSLEVLETEGNYPKLTVLQVPPRLSRVTF